MSGLTRPSTGSPGKSPKKWRSIINLANPSGNDFVNQISD
jgi:hypothetical protein